MARQATGQVVVRQRKTRRVYALRFRANGERQYITLGTDAEGWDHKRAEGELEAEMAKVKAGVWRPPTPEPVPAPAADPSFHEFAGERERLQALIGGIPAPDDWAPMGTTAASASIGTPSDPIQTSKKP
jgi:hypothetical protein